MRQADLKARGYSKPLVARNSMQGRGCFLLALWDSDGGERLFRPCRPCHQVHWPAADQVKVVGRAQALVCAQELEVRLKKAPAAALEVFRRPQVTKADW